MNLRELTNKYGRNVGLNVTAVAVYAAQLLVALRHLRRCRVLHADIKPDNILVNARRSKVKVQFKVFKLLNLIALNAPPSAVGELDITYLDEELRISRGDKGNLFILTQDDPDGTF